MLIKPILDRTQADVDYARLNRNNTQPLKGTQNYLDWARLTGNIYFLAEKLTEYGYSVSVNSKQIWKVTDIPTENEINQIRIDVEKLRNAFITLQSTPNIPLLPLNNYLKINDMEQIIFDINMLMENMVNDFIFSNEIYSAEDDWV